MQIYWPWQIRVVVKRGRKIKEGNFTCVPTYEAHENRRRRRVKITPKEEGRKERRELFSINPWNSFFVSFEVTLCQQGGEEKGGLSLTPLSRFFLRFQAGEKQRKFEGREAVKSFLITDH